MEGGRGTQSSCTLLPTRPQTRIFIAEVTSYSTRTSSTSTSINTGTSISASLNGGRGKGRNNSSKADAREVATRSRLSACRILIASFK